MWSLGCTVVELITAKPPWPDMGNAWSAMYKIVQSKGPPSNTPLDLPDPPQAFLGCCFQRDVPQRPSAAELLEQPWMQGVGGGGTMKKLHYVEM